MQAQKRQRIGTHGLEVTQFSLGGTGFGNMYSYTERVNPRDRWAIAAYIRVLQLSQGANLSELPVRDQQQIQSIIEVE